MAQTALVYDCFSGISGDMHIGAMVDVGVPAEYLHAELARLDLADEFTLELNRGTKMGITGTRAEVKLRRDKQPHARHLADICAIIDAAGYPQTVARAATSIFRRIAEAEARIHGTSIEAVHFHEVGATDAIVDIVAAALCLEHLGVDTVLCPMVELGAGTVRCAHGVMPVPAPATAEILRDVPCHLGRVDGEATTPTGAAILKHAVHRFEAPERFVVRRIGYGLGHKDFQVPNVLRVMVGEIAERTTSYEVERNLEIECNIDDMSPEAYTPLMDTLYAGGAREVFFTPVVMKKSRPGSKVTVLAPGERLEEIVALLFENSTTIGLRIHEVEKRMLVRETRNVETSLGSLRVKVVTLPGGRIRWKPEHDDVQAAADAHHVDYLTAHRRLARELADLLGGPDG